MALAERGAHVWAIDIVANELEDTERLCVEAGGRCEGRTVDITQPRCRATRWWRKSTGPVGTSIFW